jgi:P-type Cu2+ transporter
VTDGGASCYHCGVAVSPRQAVSTAAEGIQRLFCCHGCECAYLLIHGAGLGEFYRLRTSEGAGVEGGTERTGFDDTALAPYIYGHQGRSAIDLLIEGIRCATCIWLNERMVAALPGVVEVRINYATYRARVVFDGELTSAAPILRRIAALGYRPRPYNRTAADSAAEAERLDLLIRFGTALFLSMQLMAYAVALYAGYFHGISSQFKGYLNYFSLLVTTPVVWYCGWPFLTGAWRGLRNRLPTMDLLIATGALASYGYSCYGTLSGGETYFETAAMIVTLILAGIDPNTCPPLEGRRDRAGGGGCRHAGRPFAG